MAFQQKYYPHARDQYSSILFISLLTLRMNVNYATLISVALKAKAPSLGGDEASRLSLAWGEIIAASLDQEYLLQPSLVLQPALDGLSSR